MLNMFYSFMYFSVLCALTWPAWSQQLQCQVFERDKQHLLHTQSLTSPYAAIAHDYAHFRFKPVLVSENGALAYAKIHVYYLTRQQPELIQIALYKPPFGHEQSLTGMQTVYSPDLGRQMSYDCRILPP